MAQFFQSERELLQRTLGCIGVSVISHTSLAVALVMSGYGSQEPFGLANGTGGESIYMDLEDPGAAPDGDAGGLSATSATTAETTSTQTPSEIMLADASDTTAIAVPSENAEPQKPPEPQQVPKAAAQDVTAHQQRSATAAASTASNASNASLAKPEPETQTITDKTGDTDVQDTALKTHEEASEASEAKNQEPANQEATEELVTAEPQDDSFLPTLNEEPIQQEEAPAISAQERPPTQDPLVEQTPEAPQQQAQLLPPKEEPTPTFAPSARVAEQAQQGANPQSNAANDVGPTSAPPGSAAPHGEAQPGGYGVPTGAQIIDASKLIARPGNKLPDYPPQDRLRNRQGTTTLVGKVEADGSISQVMIERSAGSPYLDQAALNAFRTWKFMPGQAGWVRQPMVFQLSGAAKINPARLRR